MHMHTHTHRAFTTPMMFGWIVAVVKGPEGTR
jgi:hypothetical protein